MTTSDDRFSKNTECIRKALALRWAPIRHPISDASALKEDRVRRLATREPCVIVGRGHSGTRIPAWICHHLGIRLGADTRVHPSGDCTDLAFKHHIRKAAFTHVEARSGAELSPEVLNRFQKAAHGFYQRLSPQGERWGWKYPETAIIAPYVATTFPKAKMIYILRDGRDIAFKAHYTDNPRHALARAILRERNALDLPHYLQAGLSWAFQVELFEAFRSAFPDASVLDLRFESLLQNPVDTGHKISEFLGIPMTESCIDYLSTAIDSSKKHEHHSEDVEKIHAVEKSIATTLRQVGYNL